MGDLCGDIWEVILGKLSLREHARVAAICREFWEPYVSKRDQERASLLAAAEESFGKNMFPTLLEVGKHPMCGLPAPIDSLVNRKEPLPEEPVARNLLDVLISDQQPPTISTCSPPSRALRNAPYGWLDTGYDCDFPCGSTLYANLHHRSGCGRYMTQTLLVVFKLATEGARLRVDVLKQGVRPAMGLLLAMCLHSPKLTSSRPRRLDIAFYVRVLQASDASAVREAEYLMEVLRAILSPAWSLGASTVVAS